MHRVFLLSPARLDGKRASLLHNPRAGFALAQGLQRGDGRPLGEIFSFLSGLYFRGKLAYASVFAKPPRGLPGAWIITSRNGLVGSDTLAGLDDLLKMAGVPIDADEPRYRRPLQRTVRALAKKFDGEFVLLGSISTAKYVEPLLEILGARLVFPTDFIGRGDMSRGGLLLRCVRDGRELAYQSVGGAMRRGKRPAKLAPSPGAKLRGGTDAQSSHGIRDHIAQQS